MTNTADKDEGITAITELAKLIQKAKLYDSGYFGKVLAVPVADIAEVMEKLAGDNNV